MMNTKHYLKTREYLSQVKEAVQKVEMLKKRIEFREQAGMDIGGLAAELESAMRAHSEKTVELADMISRIPRVSYQWLLTKRYVELLGWDEIAEDGNISCRSVISDHGLALPEMQDVLVDAGIISPEDAEDIKALLEDEGTEDTGTIQDYLKYREEKKKASHAVDQD